MPVDPAPIRERWTIHACEDHRAMDCALCGVFDVVAVVPVPDEAAIERGALRLASEFGYETAWAGGPEELYSPNYWRALALAVLRAALEDEQ